MRSFSSDERKKLEAQLKRDNESSSFGAEDVSRYLDRARDMRARALATIVKSFLNAIENMCRRT